MVSIHTNLSSLIAQGSLTKSTNTLNRAIEQMSTGYKINHASDNAANYSIKTNMDTKIGAYQVAEENAMMGLDMLQTAESSLNQISDKLSRLRALAVTAQNGTYGTSSISALESEAEALVAEVDRAYKTTKYNGINLLNNYDIQLPESLESLTPKLEYKNFIENPVDYTDAAIALMTKMSEVDVDNDTISSGQYSISTAEDLAKLATMTNDGRVTGGEFVLAEDIDLAPYLNGASWTPIGNSTNNFSAVFNGNGHVIKNLKIDSNDYCSGLFGRVLSSTIKNVGLVDCSVSSTQNHVGGLVGFANGETGQVSPNSITNTFVLGSLKGVDYVGAIVGYNESGKIEKSYANATVSGSSSVGGISGYYQSSTLSKCFFEGAVCGGSGYAGGVVGSIASSISDCYSIATVEGSGFSAGLIGLVYTGSGAIRSISNCHVYGSVLATPFSQGNEFIGRVGITNDDITFGDIDIKDCSSLSFEKELIGRVCNYSSGYTYQDYDKSSWLNGINQGELGAKKTNLLIGVNSLKSSDITVATSIRYKSLEFLSSIDLENGNFLEDLDNLLLQVTNKQAELGAAQNRLMSVLEEINLQYENLVSSRSTIQDADMSEVSATYIQQQILQQASATLMATANQTPAIALQLI